MVGGGGKMGGNSLGRETELGLKRLPPLASAVGPTPLLMLGHLYMHVHIYVQAYATHVSKLVYVL